MSDLQNYVAIPMWLLVVLLFLSSGAVQYVLIGAVRLVMHIARTRAVRAVAKAEKAKAGPTIILLDDHRTERAQ